MIIDTIGNIFDFIPERNLTEEYFYEHVGEFPVYSGQTVDEGIVAYIDTYFHEGEMLTFTTYGVGAGKIFSRNGKFTVGRNCMGLKLKQNYISQIILDWFKYKYQNLFYRLRIGDVDGQRSLNKILLENISIEIPDKEIQLQELAGYRNIENAVLKLEKLNSNVDALLNYKFTFKPKYQDKIENILTSKGGNSGLTEEFVYYNLPTDEYDSIPIYSGATQTENYLGSISRNARPNNSQLKIFKAPSILVVRKGLAGKMFYIDKGEFTTNDDAYVFSLKNEWKNKVNLLWFSYHFQELFFNLVTSKSDNATLNKEYVLKQTIELPDKVRFQDKIAEKIEHLFKTIENNNSKLKSLKSLLEFQIS
jgi:restriction endonuclease S subunit